ncbi:MAG: hypothetical protein AB8G26_05865, partial [Ilumatobacter sp.]
RDPSRAGALCRSLPIWHDDGVPDADQLDRHTALTSTRRGRAAVAVAVAVMTVWIIGPNMPA